MLFRSHVYLELTDRRMSYDVFDQPLTVSVYLPDDLDSFKTSYGGEARNVMMFYVSPGEEIVIPLRFQ